MRALVVGESLVDVVQGPGGETLGRHPGGSPANVALGLARLDNRVELTYDEYRELHENFAASSDTYTTPKTTNAPFRLSGVTEHQRRYEAQ